MGCLIRSKNWLPFASTGVQPRVFGGVLGAQFFSSLCCVFVLYLVHNVVCVSSVSPLFSEVGFVLFILSYCMSLRS